MMLTDAITQFLEKITSMKLLDVDKPLILKLQELAKQQAPSIDLLYQIFTERFDKILDTPYDYTLSTHAQTHAWIEFAKAISKEPNAKKWLNILIPGLKCTVDPNIFTPYNESYPLQDAILSEKTDALMSRKGLVQIVFNHPVLTTFDVSHRLRALTVKELKRIRDGSINMVRINKIEYDNFWKFLRGHADKQKQYIPISMTVTLFGLLQENSIDKTQALLDELYSYDVDVVTRFYFSSLSSQDENTLMMDYLIEAYECCTSQDKVKKDAFKKRWKEPLLAWLACHNPSLILEHADEFYKKMKRGKHISRDELIMLARATDLTKEQQEHLQTKNDINEIVKLLTQYAQSRWDQRTTSEKHDYTRFYDDPQNGAWLRIAQSLAGAGLINEYYYRFLMPTLSEQAEEPVWLYRLVDKGLEHYILSDDACSLIALDSCIINYEKHKIFGVFNAPSRTVKRLTSSEVRRIEHADLRYLHYIVNHVDKRTVIASVSKKTMLEVKKLVDGLLRDSGLFADGGQYNLRESQEANEAYHHFNLFYVSLDKKEKQRLNKQPVSWNEVSQTFGELYHRLSQGHCAPSTALILAKLVIDYDPDAKFSEKLGPEAKSQIDDMRQVSEHRVYSEYDSIRKHEAKLRILAILVKLMSPDFRKNALTGTSVHIWDQKAYLSSEMFSLFNILKPMIESDDFTLARFYYAKVLDSLGQGTFKEDLFLNHKHACDFSSIILHIRDLKNENYDSASLIRLFDEVMKSQAQRIVPDFFREFRMNVKCQEHIPDKLPTRLTRYTKEMVHEALIELMVWRISNLTYTSVTFFPVNCKIDKSMIEPVILEKKPEEASEMLTGLILSLKSMVIAGKEAMIELLRQLDARIDFAQTVSHVSSSLSESDF